MIEIFFGLLGTDIPEKYWICIHECCSLLEYVYYNLTDTVFIKECDNVHNNYLYYSSIYWKVDWFFPKNYLVSYCVKPECYEVVSTIFKSTFLSIYHADNITVTQYFCGTLKRWLSTSWTLNHPKHFSPLYWRLNNWCF